VGFSDGAWQLIEDARRFIEHQAVDFLQPDLLQSGGITGFGPGTCGQG
jgi:L-alanine-DL-glutamate epimerase-like enolase superfamily enzyme